LYSIITAAAETHTPPQIQNLHRNELYAALGDKLTIQCEAIGHYDASVAWYHGDMNQIINELIAHCDDKSRTYCLGRFKDEYKQQRVSSLIFKAVHCTEALSIIINRLEIAIVDWKDISYRCMTFAIIRNPTTNIVEASQESNFTIYIG